MDQNRLENDSEEHSPQQECYGDEETGEGEANAPQADSVGDIPAQPFPNDLQYGEEGELLILDCEHPLVLKRRAAYQKVLEEQSQKLDLALKEKREQFEANKSHLEEISCHMFKKQAKLAIQTKKLKEVHEATDQAQTKHQQAQERLGETTSQYDHRSKEHNKAETSVSQLQATLDKLKQHLLSTQEVSKDLSSKIKNEQNVARKMAGRRTQVNEQKLKQDLYVDHLMWELNRLTEKANWLKASIFSTSEETEAMKESLNEVDMNLEVLMIVQKQLNQQWNSSLLAMRKQDEACSSIQEAVRNEEHKLILLQRELVGQSKFITEKEEENKELKMQIQHSEINNIVAEKSIAQKDKQIEAQLTLYTTLKSSLMEIEGVQNTDTESTRYLESNLNDQRKKMEKNTAAHLKQEDIIRTHLEQNLSHTNAAKYSKQLTGRMAALRREKQQQLVQKENELMVKQLAIHQVEHRLSGLTFTQEALKEELAKQAEELTLNENKIASLTSYIEQRQLIFTKNNHKIAQLMTDIGQKDQNPLQRKLNGIMAQNDELKVIIKTCKQQWMKQQDILMGLTQKLEVTRRDIRQLQKDCTCLQKQEIMLDGQSEFQEQEVAAIYANENILHRDRTRLCSLISEHKELHQAVHQEKALIETNFQQLKEAERESIALQAKQEKVQEEKELLLNSLLEVTHQVLLWEKKMQLLKETQAVLNTEWGKEERQKLNAELHYREVHLDRLVTQQAKLLKEGDAAAEKLARNIQGGCFKPQALQKKKPIKGAMLLTLKGLQRQIKDTNKLVAEGNKKINELQQSLEELSIDIKKKTELCETNDTTNSEFVYLQNSKDINLAHLVALQEQQKRLQKVRAGSYHASSDSQSVAAGQQSLMEHLHNLSRILHQVCEEIPQNQGVLSKLSQSLAAHTESHSGMCN